ncbi:MAG: DNA mismatch repair endonuclease MutL [Firmicutes bacterium]|nr:DNA mismatch repair endonuclease MutL [Bacillota bacterium]
MNNKIIILDENTINQIAAGEVIEQPSSVVKELVENSIDAGASQITISILEAGLKEIKVVDNGYGIDEENIQKAFFRYGTSKLQTIDDLYSLDTMGFRGEALASISSVSKIKISSRTANDDYGLTLEINGGSIKDKKAEPMNIGTSIKVNDLFYNTPVRQKFLKSILSETRDIIDIAEKLAISRPDIAFTLNVDGKIIFKTRGKGNIKEIASQVFSFDIGKELIPFEFEKDGLKMWGLAGNFNVYRGTKDYIVFFINSRYVINKELTKAFETAYKNRIPINKYPIGIIYLEIPQYLVEVNIHPRKMEVKIDQGKLINDFIKDSVESLLLSSNKLVVNQDVKPVIANRQVEYNKAIKTEMVKEEQISFDENIKKDSIFKQIEIKGTIKSTYIIAMLNDVLYIVDQHAAHERVNYEAAVKQFKEIGFKTQMLIEPYLLTLNHTDYIRVVENIEKIFNYGILLESFGDDSFLIRGLPLNIIGEEASKDFIMDLIDSFDNDDSEVIKDMMLEKAACSRSVKAGNFLNYNEIKGLLEMLGECEFPYTCPHGRPTLIKFSDYDLEKMFLRSK